MRTYKIQTNASGTRSIMVSEEHLNTIKKYSLLKNLIDSNGFIDEAVLSLPFNPTCEGGCDSQATGVPAPDGVSGEQPEEERVDPRWAGLEKFLRAVPKRRS